MGVLGRAEFVCRCVAISHCIFVTDLALFAAKISLIFIVVFTMVCIHVVSVIWRHGCRFFQRMPSLIASVGTIFMALLISTMSTILTPFQCVRHPGDVLTVRSYLAVECWNSSTHSSMVLTSILALIAPVSFLTGCLYVIKQMPQRMSKAKMTRADES